MKKLALALVLLLASAAYGTVDIPFTGAGAQVDGTTTTKTQHIRNVASNGRVHTDVNIDASGIGSSEVAFWNLPYSSNTVGSNFTMHVMIETDETDVAKQICLRFQACAMRTATAGGKDFADCGGETVGVADLVWQVQATLLPANIYDWLAGPSTIGVIYSSGTIQPCDQTKCGNSTVQLSVRRYDTITDCTNPSTARFSIVSGVLHEN